MILHLVYDEKVVNRAIDFFEKALPEQNIVLCFCQKGKGKSYSPKHVAVGPKIIFYDDHKDEVALPFNEIHQIVAHSLGGNHIKFIEQHVPDNIPICWLVWGYDLYSQILVGAGYHLYSYCNSSQTKKEWLYNRIKQWIGYRSEQSRYLTHFVQKRISSVGACDGDHELLKKYGIINDYTRVDFFYYPIKDILGSMYGNFLAKDADVIMCGNSASEAGNHEYIFKYLHKLGIGERRVVVPLSYCGTDKYKATVRRKGYELFGAQFEPLLDFIPLDKYNELFLKASICIYGSWRQMAVGNILIALYMGAKVYLSKHNPWLKDAREAGYKVFILEQATRKSFAEQLTEQDKSRNRQLVEASHSSERLISLIKSQFEYQKLLDDSSQNF